MSNYMQKTPKNKTGSLEEMGKFLELCNLPQPKHVETGNMNRPITSKKISSVIKNLQIKIKSGTR